MQQNSQASSRTSPGDVDLAGAAIMRTMRDLADGGMAENAIALAALNAAIDMLAGAGSCTAVPEPLLHRLVAFRLQQHDQETRH